MRLLATASGAWPPVRRRPLNLSERHFSSITRNPTSPHNPSAVQPGQSRFTTLGSSGSRRHGERSIHVSARRASWERQRTKRETGTSTGKGRDQKKMPVDPSRSPLDPHVQSEHGRLRQGLNRSRTVTAHAFSQWLSHALCGGAGMPEARGHPSAFGSPWISGHSSLASVLVQDRRKSAGPSQRERTTTGNVSGETGPVSLRIHQQTPRPSATRV